MQNNTVQNLVEESVFETLVDSLINELKRLRDVKQNGNAPDSHIEKKRKLLIKTLLNVNNKNESLDKVQIKIVSNTFFLLTK